MLLLLPTFALVAPAAASAAWLAPVDVSLTDLPAFDPRVAVEPDGDALIAWSRSLGEDPGALQRVQMRHRAADGTLGKVVTLTPGSASRRSRTS